MLIIGICVWMGRTIRLSAVRLFVTPICPFMMSPVPLDREQSSARSALESTLYLEFARVLSFLRWMVVVKFAHVVGRGVVLRTVICVLLPLLSTPKLCGSLSVADLHTSSSHHLRESPDVPDFHLE